MKLSIVDISPVSPGKSNRDALNNSIALAKHAEKLGFTRLWYAEHHGAPSVAGRAPEVMISTIAANTSTIKIGSGAVLLNHYSPFKVAEVFCTLNELYPGRIDLGAGRATTGPITDFALQQEREKTFHSDSNQQIVELVSWLDNSFPEDHLFSRSPIHSIDDKPDLYLLGSSSWSASAAAALGLKYVFAGFINQYGVTDILNYYRRNFQPAKGKSGTDKPEFILGIHVVCADTEDEARRQLAPVNVMYNNLSKGIIDKPLLDPDSAVKELGSLPKLEKYTLGSGRPPKFIGGTPDMVQDQLNNLAKDLKIEEIMIQDIITEFDARLHSYELLAKMIS